jgi:hypothetical protein
MFLQTVLRLRDVNLDSPRCLVALETWTYLELEMLAGNQLVLESSWIVRIMLNKIVRGRVKRLWCKELRIHQCILGFLVSLLILLFKPQRTLNPRSSSIPKPQVAWIITPRLPALRSIKYKLSVDLVRDPILLLI